MDKSIPTDIARDGLCPHIRGEDKCPPWHGQHGNLPQLSDYVLDTNDSAVTHAVVSKLAEGGYTIDQSKPDLSDRIADEISRDMEKPFTNSHLSFESQ